MSPIGLWAIALFAPLFSGIADPILHHIPLLLGPALPMDFSAASTPANSAGTAVFAGELGSLATSESIDSIRMQTDFGSWRNTIGPVAEDWLGGVGTVYGEGVPKCGVGAGGTGAVVDDADDGG
jgi:hypothetical protein